MITLRNLAMDDAPALQHIYRGESVRFTRGKAMDARHALAYVAEAIRWRNQSPWQKRIFGIDATGDLLGVIKILRSTENEAETSYILRENAWRNGYATQAVDALLELAFTTLGLDTITAKHHPDNPASGRVLAKNGFTRTTSTDEFVTYAARRTGSISQG